MDLSRTVTVQHLALHSDLGLASNRTCCPLLSSLFSLKLMPVFIDTLRGVRAAGPQYPLRDKLSEALKLYPLSDQSTGCFLTALYHWDLTHGSSGESFSEKLLHLLKRGSQSNDQSSSHSLVVFSF